jgi:hypothetical protein
MIDLAIVDLTTKRIVLADGVERDVKNLNIVKPLTNLYNILIVNRHVVNLNSVQDGLYTVQHVTNEFEDYALNLVPYICKK